MIFERNYSPKFNTPLMAWCLHGLVKRCVLRRPPDRVIGDRGNPYLLRWYITPWRGWYEHVPEEDRTRWQRAVVAIAAMLPKVYVHSFHRPDDDRALHDHPWASISLMLDGACHEYRHLSRKGRLVNYYTRHLRVKFRIKSGMWVYRPAELSHRIGLDVNADGAEGSYHPCVTLFMTGPNFREWGFWCERGWVHWKNFLSRGCE